MARRPAEFHYYDWNFHRWFGSNTRAHAKAITPASLPPELRDLPADARDFVLQAVRLAAMGAYRELLDYCYNDGEIPGDIGGIASLCGCGPELIEVIWPTFKGKFHATKKAEGKLVNDEVNLRRKTFSQRRKQKNSDQQETDEKKGRRKPNPVNGLGHDGEPIRADIPKVGSQVISSKYKVESNKKEVITEEEDSELVGFVPPNQEPRFDYTAGFRELWDLWPSKARTKIIDSQRLYVETVSPDPERLHESLVAPVRPGGKWAESANWKRGYVCAIAEYIRNRRDLEEPESFEESQKKQGSGVNTSARRSAFERSLENA